jgi:hypothetical protein
MLVASASLTVYLIRDVFELFTIFVVPEDV